MNRFAIAVLASTLATPAAAAPPAETAPPALDKAAIEAIVRDYILANPGIVAEALETHAAAQAAEAEAAGREAAVALTADLIADPTTPRIGAAEPAVTMIEFFDYNCGYCRRAAETVIALSERQNDLSILLIETPILGPGSVETAQVALAAARQDAYWEFHQAMLRRRGRADRAASLAVAEELGLDLEKLQADMEDPAIATQIAHNLERAQRVGVRGTPAFIVGDAFIPGAAPLEQLEAAIADARGT